MEVTAPVNGLEMNESSPESESRMLVQCPARNMQMVDSDFVHCRQCSSNSEKDGTIPASIDCINCGPDEVKIGNEQTYGESEATESETMTKDLAKKEELDKRLVTDKDLERLRYLETKLADLEEANMCSICMERKRNVAFLCGHGACDHCAAPLKTCHMCRQTITQKINLY